MKNPFALGSLVLVIVALCGLAAKTVGKISDSGNTIASTHASTNIMDLSDEEFQNRLNSLSEVFEFKLTPLVKEHIISKVTYSKATTERVLGLGEMYFPTFEKALLENNVPTQLKYLPVVESNLNPLAHSPRGAGGLWQFMPATGTMYGLRIDKYVDERKDPFKSSAAAAKLLSNLHLEYGDWALALAAYNAGQVKVNAALRSASENNYWAASNYFNNETRTYVPKFIAAVYVSNYYYMHDLTPVELPQDYLATDTLHLYENTTFVELAKKTGTPESTVKVLNPSYLRDFVPANKKGNIVTLPLSQVAAVKGYSTSSAYATDALVAAASALKTPTTSNVAIATHVLGKNETLQDVANIYHCTVDELNTWNKLKPNTKLIGGSVLEIRESTSSKKTVAIASTPSPAPVAASPVAATTAAVSKTSKPTNVTEVAAPANTVANATTKKVLKMPAAPKMYQLNNDGFLYHRVQPGDNIWKIAKRYNGSSAKQIIALNGADRVTRLKPGDYIKIAQKQ